MKTSLYEIYLAMLNANGHQGWWPGDSPFEIAVGAVLTQNTSWNGVEAAISNLKTAGLLSAQAILDAPDDRIAELIRPSGYFNVKTGRLKALCDFLIRSGADDPARLASQDIMGQRERLLAVKGVGRETADSILLYAAGLPIFVVDAYTRRIFGRLGLIDGTADYDVIRAFFESGLERDVPLFGDFHAQIVRCAKDFCRTRPMCLKCPLKKSCQVGAGGSIG